LIPIIVDGEPDSSLPARIASAAYRHIDARRAWMLGWLRPGARDELLRAVAVIAEVDLRQLIPWDRRRRRRVLVASIAAVALLALAALFVPFEHTRPIGRPVGIGPDATIEFCDVVDDKLLVAARETYARGPLENTTYAGYLAIYSDAIGAPRQRAWFDQTRYLPASRLLHVSTRHEMRALADGIDLAQLRASALELAQEWQSTSGGEEALAKRALEPGFWAAAPAKDVKVVLMAVKPSPSDPAAAEGPPPGKSAIALKDDAHAVQLASAEGLYPPPIPARPPTPRSAALAQGLPIAATPREVFIGMPARSDGGIGGLWRWHRQHRTWQRENFSGQSGMPHGNVVSIVSDPRHPGRVLLSTAAADWTSSSRKGRYAAAVYERPTENEPWRAINLVPIDSESGSQLCGFASDATLFVRVNATFYAAGPYNLARLLLHKN
jgi:hypothetical protein